MTPTVDVYCDCGWEGCWDVLSRPVADLRTDDIVLDKVDRTRAAVYRAFAERGHAPEALVQSTMPVRLHDGPMPWAFYESLPAAGDSFAGVTLRIPLTGKDLFHSRIDACDYARCTRACRMPRCAARGASTSPATRWRMPRCSTRSGARRDAPQRSAARSRGRRGARLASIAR